MALSHLTQCTELEHLSIVNSKKPQTQLFQKELNSFCLSQLFLAVDMILWHPMSLFFNTHLGVCLSLHSLISFVYLPEHMVYT